MYVLYVHRDRMDYWKMGGQDGHLHFHTPPELCSLMLLYVHRDHKDYWQMGTQDGHLDFHTAPELCHGT